jgi:hypothetical protein
MYEDATQFAAGILAVSRGATTPPKKLDRSLAMRLGKVLAKLDAHGFGSWGPGVLAPADPKSSVDGRPRVRIVGNLVDKGESIPVYMDLWNHHNRLTPKDIAYSVCKLSNDRGVIVGTMVRDIIRYTDLRDMISQYDGGTWTERHFRAQLGCDAANKKLPVSPELILGQMSAAVKQLVELGITNECHALLPAAGDELQHMTMTPYLVGMYGAMPCAIRLAYQQDCNLKMEFYIVSGKGLCKVDFGYILIGISTKVLDKAMDIGKLLAGPKAK